MGVNTIGRLALAATVAWGLLAGAAAQAGEVTFWTWRQEDKAVYTELFAEFTKANPGITVKFEAFPNENYNTIVTTALAGGKGGDVLHARAYGGLEAMAKSGYYLALDKTNVPELDNLPADAQASESLRADGKVYAVSLAGQTLGLLVNKDVFATAGVAVPGTWAELLSACTALKAKGIVPIANGTATPWMDAIFATVFTNPFLGPQWVTDMLAGKTNFADAKFTGALRKLLDLRACMPDGFTGVDYATSQQLFSAGRAAIFVGGSFEIAPFRRANPKLNLDFIAPPAPEAGQPTYVSRFFDSGFAVNAKSANPADALKLVRWMATKDFAAPAAAKLGNISSLKDVANPDPLLGKIAKLNETAMPYIGLVYFRYESPTGTDLLQDGVQKMMGGTMTAQAAGDAMTQGIAHYYKPFQK
jgi:raffinose/stachyose/melibiose transport system substrate-binding protein